MPTNPICFPASPASAVNDRQIHAAMARGRALHGRAIRGAFVALWRQLVRRPAHSRPAPVAATARALAC